MYLFQILNLIEQSKLDAVYGILLIHGLSLV